MQPHSERPQNVSIFAKFNESILRRGRVSLSSSIKTDIFSACGILDCSQDDAHNLGHGLEQILCQTKVSEIFNFQFQVEGIHFFARRHPEVDSDRLIVWATLGILPYSAESLERRALLISIIESARTRLKLAKFYVDREHRIIVSCEQGYKGKGIQEFLIIPLLPFLQEALPFIRLMGTCL